MTLRRRLVLGCAAVVAVVAVVGSIVAYAVVRDSLRGTVDDSLRAAAARAGRLPPHLVGDRLRRASPLAGPAIAVSVEGPGAPAGRARFEDRTIDGVHARVHSVPGPPGLTVEFARPLTEVDRVLGRLRIGLGILALAGALGAALLVRAAALRALRPVEELTSAAEHVARTRDLSRRIEAGDADDEPARLAGAFNTMLAALERSQQAQRRLVADASHELRTPLTSLRTNLEVLAAAGALDEPDRERLRADVVAQLEDLGVLVGDLVDLAREEAPQEEREDVRLDEIVAAAVARARRQRPAVAFEAELEPCLVSGSPARLDRAVANLLDNAAKFGAGAPVEVRLRDGELTVRDHGPGIADADLPHVFDRFWRAPGARSTPGSGLGLAIVRQVAETHGGSVTAEAADGGGARLRIRLPAVAPAAGGRAVARAV